MSRLLNIFIFLLFLTLFSLISSSSLHDVIIIGAGASGLASFSDLSRNKIDVLLLEAENRIGGRINSVKFGGNGKFVDLGAQWVHENALKEPFYKLAIDLGLLEKSNDSRIDLFYSNRKELPNDVIKKIQQIEREIYEDEDVSEGISIGEFAKKRFNELTDKIKSPEGFSDLLEDLLEHFRHKIQAAEGTLDWNQPSARSDSLDHGNYDYNWKGNGYKAILDILLDKTSYGSNSFDTENKILLNKKVTKISWNNSDEIVTIFCDDSSEYQSKKVIFTPSLGVLKSKMDKLFDPILPEIKRKAIENLGIGAVVKVYLEYTNDWFNKYGKVNVFEVIWEKTMRKSMENFKTDNRTWITNLSAILAVESNPKVLCFWFDGLSVPFVENLSHDKLMEGIQFALNQFFGDKFDIPKPIKMLRSKWYTNENFLGTYSFQTVESRKRPSHKDLGESLKNQNGKEVVFFAGEATSPEYYGSVHGAIHTGLREAENVKK